MAAILQTTFSHDCVFLTEKFCTLSQISLKFVPESPFFFFKTEL